MTSQATRSFAVVRPYPSQIRKRVFSFLQSMSFELGPGLELATGTPDDVAARWLEAVVVDMLLLPFHVHRDANGSVVDGVGVALRIPKHFVERNTMILMPVSAFSLSSTFPRRFEELQKARPGVHRQVILMPESEIGAERIRTLIRRPPQSSLFD